MGRRRRSDSSSSSSSEDSEARRLRKEKKRQRLRVIDATRSSDVHVGISSFSFVIYQLSSLIVLSMISPTEPCKFFCGFAIKPLIPPN